MTRLAAIISFALGVIFNAWDISHVPFTWTFFLLLGLLLWCISEHPRIP